MKRGAQQPAEASGRSMSERDPASDALGMRLLEVRPGYARVQMTVREDMINLHGTAHGGLVFTLADSAFAFASNSHGKVAVAASCSIDFLLPARLGDELTALAVEQALVGRSGVYDVRVENGRGELVALFRGKSAQLKGTLAEAVPDTR